MAGIVLAGGHSRRMGRDKLLLPLQGSTILQRVLDVVTGVADDVILVGRTHAGVRCIEDRWPGEGALGGLLSGLLASENDVVLTAAGDLPFLNGRLLRRLVSMLDSYDAVVPRLAGGAEPLHAVYRRDVAGAGEQILAGGDRRLMSFVEKLDVRWVLPDEIVDLDPGLRSFTNVNTESDWREAQKFVG